MEKNEISQDNDVVINIHDDKLEKDNKKCSIRERIFEIIEVSKTGDTKSTCYDCFIIIIIIVGLIPMAFKEEYNLFYYTDNVVVTIFIIDYILRFITADYKLKKKSIISFIRYPFTPWAIVDILSILPSLTIIYQSFKLLRIINLIKTLKIIRVFKTFRYNKSIFIITDVIKESKKPLIAVCTLAFGYILVSALIIFNVEGDSFESFFSSVYWATVSLTTVGYGDLYPVTTEGRVIAMISSVCGIALVALPAGIITAGYIDSVNSILGIKESINKLVSTGALNNIDNKNSSSNLSNNNDNKIIVSNTY